MRDDGPVRVRAGAQAQPRRARSPLRSTTQRVAPRGLSTRPMPIGRAVAAGLGGARARAGRRAGRRAARTTAAARARAARAAPATSPAAPSATAGREAVVGEPRGRRAHVLGDPARARGRAGRAERARVRGGDDADARQPVLERGVEAAARASPLARPRASARELVARGRARPAASSASALPPTCDAAEQEAVAGRARVQPARPLGERGEAVVAGGEADAGADRGDVVEVAPDPLELEQERARARELRRRREPERVLAGVRVGDARSRPRTPRRRAARTRARRSSVRPSAARSSPRCL